MATALTVRVFEGAAAREELGSSAFLEQWRALQQQCPWATAFQDQAFVLTWYEAYADEFAPMLIIGTREGTLAGLLTLGAARDGRIVVTGGRQAEYQVWLCSREDADVFPAEALRALGRRHRQPLVFQFLPANTPVAWVEGADARGIAVRLEGVPRSSMDVVNTDASESLKKKSNKSRINRLARLGELKFRRLTSANELAELLPQIAMIYDLRQIALGGEPPFASDDRKAPFHLALMARPNLLHVAVLTVGGNVVAAHLGVNDGKVLHLGILTHSPAYGVHSPGKFIILYLAQLLQSEGFRSFDLTPGGDSWKDRFATDHDSVWRLVAFPTRAARARHDTSSWAAEQARTVLRAGGVAPASAKQAVSHALSEPLGTLKSAVGWGASKVYRRSEIDLYIKPIEKPADESSADRPARNDLAALMQFRSAPGAPKRQAFLQVAVARLEEGQDVFTVVERGRLVHWGWLADVEEKIAAGDGQEIAVPAGSALIYDFFTAPKERKRGYSRRTIDEMARQAAGRGITQLVALVSADQRPWRDVLTDAGFKRSASLGTRVVAGVTKRWQRNPSSGS